MKKSSAITLSILILLVALALLLGITSFFVDQSVIYPLVLMMDTEVNLKCFLSLINLNNEGYIRQGDDLSRLEGTLKGELIKNYDIEQNIQSFKNDEKLQELGYSGVFMGNEAEFRTLLRNSDYQVMCYTRSYGPKTQGYIAIYRQR